MTYRPVSHAKQSHTETLQGRGTETPVATTDTQEKLLSFLFLVHVLTASLCIGLHSWQTSLRLKKSFCFQDSTPFQVTPDTQLWKFNDGNFNICFVFLCNFCQKGSTYPVFNQTNCNWLKLILHRSCLITQSYFHSSLQLCNVY